jgi:hypothetical protein
MAEQSAEIPPRWTPLRLEVEDGIRLRMGLGNGEQVSGPIGGGKETISAVGIGHAGDRWVGGYLVVYVPTCMSIR